MTVPTLPSYVDDILSTLIMGMGEGLVKSKAIDQDALQAATDALGVLSAVGWRVIAANPDKTPPLAILMALVRSTPPAQQARWNEGVKGAVAAALAYADPLIHAAIHKHLGILAGPADGIVDHGVQSGADAAAKLLETQTQGN